jgi:transposase
MRIAGAKTGGKGAVVRFAETPWNEQTPQWQALEQSLPAEHLVRQIAGAAESLDLTALYATYAGRGSKPLRPELLLKLVLYEKQSGRPSPAQWFRDARENGPVQWLLRGLRPSRTALYEFWARVAGLWDGWNAQVLARAGRRGMPVGERVATDGSLIGGLASRHRLVNQKTLTLRQEALEQAVAADAQGQALEKRPGWMAKHPATRARQLQRYRQAQARLDQLQAANAHRKRSKRKKPEKIVVSVSDPEAALGRDKSKVFRPLYNAQLMYDLDAAFITAYGVFACQNDPETIGPMFQRAQRLAGRLPRVELADASYAGGSDLALCKQAGVVVYAPVSANDFSDAKRKSQKTPQLSKQQFRWLPEEQTYCCPEGHRFARGRTTSLERSNDRAVLQTMYRCDPEHCLACPRRGECTPAPEKGRSVSRLEHEDLVEELRVRMETAEAKALYKLRRQTIELRYADLKEHRQLRRFHGYGLKHAQAEVGAMVLAYNLLILLKHQKSLDAATQHASIPAETPP